MSACLMVAGKALMLASPLFTLGWTHSVEKTGWQEDWLVQGNALVLQAARVKGSGAGMDPGDGAVLRDGWWVWHPERRLERLELAASGATVSGWTLCSDGTCHELGIDPGQPIEIAPCAGNG